MITINAFLTIKPEKKIEYLEVINQLVEASRQDQGCLYYSHCADLADENKFVIVEHWADQAAVDLHNQTPHLQHFIKRKNEFASEANTVISHS